MDSHTDLYNLFLGQFILVASLIFWSKEFHNLSKYYAYINVCFGLSNNMFPLLLVPLPLVAL